MGNNNLQNSEEIAKALKKDLASIKKLKEANPEEYAKKLREYVDSLKEFNKSVKDLLDFAKE